MPDLNLETLFLFLLFVVPGFIAMKIYGLIIPSAVIDLKSRVLEAISYSMINIGAMFVPIALMLHFELLLKSPVWFAILGFLIVFVSPGLLGYLFAKFRRSDWGTSIFLHPSPTAWDFYFDNTPPCWLICHLKNGKMVGGFYGLQSYATAYPRESQMYFEEVWRIDEHGRFADRIDRSNGMIVRYDDCELIEFFEWEVNDG